MDTPKISVIVPVYNVVQYLPRCIDSILAQTFTDFELLLVDDGSPDNSGKICDEYAEKDSRIHVFHKENGGVSSARNAGLELAMGIYCCFVDSDDWLTPTYLQNFIDCHPEEYDVVLQSFYISNTYKNHTETRILPDKEIVGSTALSVFLEEYEGVHNGFLWHRLFHLDIIKKHKIRFPEGISFAEDGCFFFNYLQYGNKYILSSKIGYYYLMDGNGLTAQGKKQKSETYRFLIESYLQYLFYSIEKEKPSNDLVNGIKKYVWRLMESWVVRMDLINEYTYSETLLYVQSLMAKYHLDILEGGAYSLKCLVSLCKESPSKNNFRCIRMMLSIRKVEQKIKSKL